MKRLTLNLQNNKKAYFAGDFHLGKSNEYDSNIREKHVVKWLKHIESDAQEIFLMGDIFDFWFEYKKSVPKGYVRLLGKLANMSDNKINIHYFLGNHDMWTINYFENLGINVYKDPTEFKIDDLRFLIGHGDGLGKGDQSFKFLKGIFRNRIIQKLFRIIHPDLGISIGNYLSRKKNKKINNNNSVINDDRIFNYCKNLEINNHNDVYVFGHSHKVSERVINKRSKYYNTGEWISSSNFLVTDCKTFKIKKF
jgi:UDP-2,3-diacylglucosamine hydrolase